MYFEKGMYLPLVEKIRDAAKVPLLIAGRMDDPKISFETFYHTNPLILFCFRLYGY